jgi:phosphatidylinositol 4-kinase A
MIEQLASLLLPIDALLTHKDFNPQFNTSAEVTALFRNMWFLCSLFHFTSYEEKEQVAMDWLKPVLGRIAIKTPNIILEEAHDTMINDLEYNTVIRHEYAHTVSFARSMRH